MITRKLFFPLVELCGQFKAQMSTLAIGRDGFLVQYAKLSAPLAELVIPAEITTCFSDQLTDISCCQFLAGDLGSSLLHWGCLHGAYLADTVTRY